MGTSAKSTGSGQNLDLDDIKIWVTSHARQLLIGGAVVVVGGAVAMFARQAKALKGERAETAYLTAQSAFYSGNRAQAKTDLQALVERYPGTNGGSLGGMLLAQAYYGDAQFDAGIKGLESLLGQAPSRYHAMIEDLIASGYADSKRPDQAAEHYLNAAQAAEFAADKDTYRADAARALEVAGKRDSARTIWTSLAAKFDSPATSEAKVRLGELDARPVQP